MGRSRRAAAEVEEALAHASGACTADEYQDQILDVRRRCLEAR